MVRCSFSISYCLSDSFSGSLAIMAIMVAIISMTIAMVARIWISCGSSISISLHCSTQENGKKNLNISKFKKQSFYQFNSQ
jgi:hypothetical protein